MIAAALVWMVPAPRRVAREPRTVPSGQGLGVLLPMQGKSLRFVAIGSLCIVLALVAGVRGLLNRELLPSVFVIGLAVLAAIAMADELQMRRRGPRGLVLTPSGVELHDRNPVETWAWDRVGDVHAWHTWVPMHNANHLPFGPRPEASNRLTLTVRPPGAAGTPTAEPGTATPTSSPTTSCATRWRRSTSFGSTPRTRRCAGSSAATWRCAGGESSPARPGHEASTPLPAGLRARVRR
ncbi:hypothetical protein [Barrientosiimonas endolithica]|uniref:Uncharacterized protein n=1 Tax=Barrientosiimonas endolithica TaxID=1535208 RepID=A0ABN6YRL1_9MICO|nr:hypothetical protein [Barrientosiimonas endolithica]BDZ60012.1 hypothetical protein GCM10025872_36690 [Barrientosiimonas endolithica]